MKTKAEILAGIAELQWRIRVVKSNRLKNGNIPLAILESDIRVLQGVLGYKCRSKGYLFCISCGVLHKKQPCPICGNDKEINWKTLKVREG